MGLFDKYTIDGVDIDSVDLKCLVVSRGIRVDNGVYKHHKSIERDIWNYATASL